MSATTMSFSRKPTRFFVWDSIPSDERFRTFRTCFGKNEACLVNYNCAGYVHINTKADTRAYVFVYTIARTKSLAGVWAFVALQSDFETGATPLETWIGVYGGGEQRYVLGRRLYTRAEAEEFAVRTNPMEPMLFILVRESDGTIAATVNKSRGTTRPGVEVVFCDGTSETIRFNELASSEDVFAGIADGMKLGEGVKRIRQTIGEHLCDFKMCLNNG